MTSVQHCNKSVEHCHNIRQLTIQVTSHNYPFPSRRN